MYLVHALASNFIKSILLLPTHLFVSYQSGVFPSGFLIQKVVSVLLPFYTFFMPHASHLLCVVTELYEYCLRENIADKNLIAKWKKQGYENLCCLRCIQTRDTNFGTNCICRVPKGKLEEVSY